jgi:hypothetical protein
MTSHAVEKNLLDIDFASLTRGPFTPSPAAWQYDRTCISMVERGPNPVSVDTGLGNKNRFGACSSAMTATSAAAPA